MTKKEVTIFSIIYGLIILIIICGIHLSCKNNKPIDDSVATDVDNPMTEVSEIIETTETIDATTETIEVIETTENTIDTETDKEVDTEEAIQPISLGEFRLTAYCSCYICCEEYALNRPVDENGNEIVYGSIGERLQAGYSIAVDPRVIPYGTEVIINGHTYKAQDCGGAIKGNRIDIYFEDHQSCSNFGVQYAEVFIKSE